MAKDINRKTRGSWWRGYVEFTFYDFFTRSQRLSRRDTEYEFATAGQALRAANQLAGALRNSKQGREYTIVSTGADRAPEP